MRRSSRQRGEGRLGCFLWLSLAALIGYAAYVILPIKLASSRFQDFIQEEAAFGSQKSNAMILQEMLNQARELELPITKEQIEINRTREVITISAHYEVPVVFFGLMRFVWRFDPSVARPLVSS